MMNGFKAELNAICKKFVDASNEILDEELDKMRAGEHVPYEGSVRKAFGFYVKDVDENPNA